MNPQPEITSSSTSSSAAFPTKSWALFGIFCVLLTAAFSLTLRDLAQYGLNNELYSHCILMPAVSLYLIWLQRDRLSKQSSPPVRAGALIPLGIALGSMALFWVNRAHWTGEHYENYLSSVVFSYVMMLYAAAVFTLGKSTLRTIAFPFFLLLFMAPFPIFFKEGIETFFQHTSAEAAYWMIKLAGTSIYREGLIFYLSSITMEVAPQCSGIRSSLVLLITSLVAAHLFLNTGWKRAVIVFFVIPLAILRNGVRIFTLGELCERIGPDMIDSWIHHKGGPLFFALSLIPFFILLYFLWRTEPQNKPLQAR